MGWRWEVARRQPIMSNINRAARPGTSRPMRRDPVSLETIPVNQESTAPPTPARPNTQPALFDPPISARKRARMSGNNGARERPAFQRRSQENGQLFYE